MFWLNRQSNKLHVILHSKIGLCRKKRAIRIHIFISSEILKIAYTSLQLSNRTICPSVQNKYLINLFLYFHCLIIIQWKLKLCKYNKIKSQKGILQIASIMVFLAYIWSPVHYFYYANCRQVTQQIVTLAITTFQIPM